MDIHSYIRECQHRIFQWGTFDCCLFAADAIRIMTGRDPMEGCRGYDSESTAAHLLRERFGTTDIRQVFLSIVRQCNARTVELGDARDGDIACIRWVKSFNRATHLDQSCGMGVVYLRQVLGCTSQGLVAIPSKTRIIDVWRF